MSIYLIQDRSFVKPEMHRRNYKKNTNRFNLKKLRTLNNFWRANISIVKKI